MVARVISVVILAGGTVIPRRTGLQTRLFISYFVTSRVSWACTEGVVVEAFHGSCLRHPWWRVWCRCASRQLGQ